VTPLDPREVLRRLAEIAAELESGDSRVAYAIVADWEIELEAEFDELERAA
jgi:hypothetical protein